LTTSDDPASLALSSKLTTGRETMRRLVIALPALLAFLVGAVPAVAWTWPVEGPVLQKFALGSDPFAGGQHRGVDVGAPEGTAVLAPAGGVIAFAGTVPGGGRAITIETPDGYAVTLVHLGALAVERGAIIGEGERVASIGPSGEVEHAVPYVHLGIRVTADENGYLDPLAFLPAPAAQTPSPAETSPEPPAAAEPGPDSPPAAGGASMPAPGVEPAPVAEDRAAGGGVDAVSPVILGEGQALVPNVIEEPPEVAIEPSAPAAHAAPAGGGEAPSAADATGDVKSQVASPKPAPPPKPPASAASVDEPSLAVKGESPTAATRAIRRGRGPIEARPAAGDAPRLRASEPATDRLPLAPRSEETGTVSMRGSLVESRNGSRPIHPLFWALGVALCLLCLAILALRRRPGESDTSSLPVPVSQPPFGTAISPASLERGALPQPGEGRPGLEASRELRPVRPKAPASPRTASPRRRLDRGGPGVPFPALRRFRHDRDAV
jgi:hypothetical protein